MSEKIRELFIEELDDLEDGDLARRAGEAVCQLGPLL